MRVLRGLIAVILVIGLAMVVQPAQATPKLHRLIRTTRRLRLRAAG